MFGQQASNELERNFKENGSGISKAILDSTLKKMRRTTK
jgi:hypothetical protein